ncbi:flagellar biosynthetic protein FliO [Pseudomonas japonica]|uniref:Flagellar biosynthesis protein, FliO n=1 Tax=Pseudomonas japonica TaxID=256466 RepID=A0A239BIX8_9PSED|nr:flagellar biosynthetic protein FliO [Pseudomonas japonica]SNS08085.1 Flagellar biosynthesis protein, FliO [Pseudomonas japonica]
MSAGTASAEPLIASAAALPLRQDDPISLLLIIKVMALTALLLAAVYLVLRWYSRRGGGAMTARGERAELHCSAALRLSPRTRVYLVEAADERLLITETPTGATVTRLGAEAPTAPASTP